MTWKTEQWKSPYQNSKKKKVHKDYLRDLWASLVAQIVKNLPCSVVDLGLIPESGRSTGEGNGNPPHCSHLDNSTRDC